MWTPKEGSTYQYRGSELTVKEVPKTAGVPTHVAENRMVRSIDEDGDERITPVVWWTKRQADIEVVK